MGLLRLLEIERATYIFFVFSCLLHTVYYQPSHVLWQMRRHTELTSLYILSRQVLKFVPGESGLQGRVVREAAHHTPVLLEQTDFI